jgi:O-antigen/teichoic acid export membrane protein
VNLFSFSKTSFLRVVNGLLSNSVFQIINIATSFLIIPIFLKFGGAQYYSEWVVIFTFSSILAFSDFSLSTVFSNLILLNLDSHKKTTDLFLQWFFYVTIISCIFSIVFFYIAKSFFLFNFLNLKVLDYNSYENSVILICIYSFFTVLINSILNIYRIFKNYSFEKYISSLLKVFEFFIILILLYKFSTINILLIYLVLFKLFSFILILWNTCKYLKEFKFSFFDLNFKLDSYIIKSGLSLTVINLFPVLIFQNLLLFVSNTFGSIFVSFYSIMKTVFGATKIPSIILASVFVNEFIYKFSEKNFVLAKKIVKFVNIFTLFLFILFAFLIVFFIYNIFSLLGWNNYEFIDANLFFIIAYSVYSLFNSLNTNYNYFLTIINRQSKYVSSFILISLIFMTTIFIFFKFSALTMNLFIILLISYEFINYLFIRRHLYSNLL